jgi:arsenate reductase-like glutaredoxin family protein
MGKVTPSELEMKEHIESAKDFLTNRKIESVIDKILKRPPTPQEVEAFNKLQDELFAEGLDKKGRSFKPKRKKQSAEDFNSMIDAFIDDFTGLKDKRLQSTLEGTPEGKAIVNTTKPAKTLGQALTIIRQQHLDKLNPVQKILLDVISKLPNVTKGTYKVMGMKKGEYGLFEPFQNKTTISPDAGVDTIFHEATHSATAFELKKHVTMKNGRPVGRTPQGQKW